MNLEVYAGISLYDSVRIAYSPRSHHEFAFYLPSGPAYGIEIFLFFFFSFLFFLYLYFFTNSFRLFFISLSKIFSTPFIFTAYEINCSGGTPCWTGYYHHGPWMQQIANRPLQDTYVLEAPLRIKTPQRLRL
ncbi:hypothetical protein M441DRAFT_346482 [Trichoderma asperellum CBS 433.97]|uniref:Uncharacterized protein n=1 Tax=Trichoderma asperellum (strain ATCC 204424 / CBS 433.97 / NBRC 101777) TaxID=1042311 RepID=A0A2T3ZHP7_TRIA4|nr:hypothetical protein M441DRAFT_346482 [Trichoderma asperellum CBS 433.97]PTB44329.1 hypothetical protein M441DRAFT_346482 [Trichoderma asperellum CBS 433.97]